MIDAPESWNDALDKEDVNAFVSDLVTRQIEAAERAAYLRGLEDAGAAVRNSCNCDSALDSIRALAKEGGK